MIVHRCDLLTLGAEGGNIKGASFLSLGSYTTDLLTIAMMGGQVVGKMVDNSFTLKSRSLAEAPYVCTQEGGRIWMCDGGVNTYGECVR